MSETKSFNCPHCGSSLSPNGAEKAVKCKYCGSTVVVPEELRDEDQEPEVELTAEEDLLSPRHVQWLIENGADATVKVDVIKDRGQIFNNNPVVFLLLSGKKASGGKFESIATINLPRNEIPRRGATLKVKYKKAEDYIFDTDDFILEINGRFYLSIVADLPLD
jgi:DNA-directed RNA polymerase subunit RPC12/RpoP